MGTRSEDTRPWTPRRLEKDDERKIPALYESVHPERAFGVTDWKWQYAEALSRNGFIWVADAGGRLAGQYATIPVRMQVGKRRMLGAQSLDTMTHPDYRRQGIFVTLARSVYDELRSQDVKLVYGFPNENSIHGITKCLEFFVLEELSALMRPFDASRLIRQKIRSGILSGLLGTPAQALFNVAFAGKRDCAGVRIESPAAFPEEVGELFRKLSGSFTNLVVRDHEYLRWRYDMNPRHSYDRILGYRNGALAGYCVCGVTERRGMTIGLIVDLFASPRDGELVGLLLRRACERFRDLGVPAALCMLTSRSPFAPAIRRAGFVFPVRRFPYTLRLNADDIDSNLVGDVRNWHITFGDGDFV